MCVPNEFGCASAGILVEIPVDIGGSVQVRDGTDFQLACYHNQGRVATGTWW